MVLDDGDRFAAVLLPDAPIFEAVDFFATPPPDPEGVFFTACLRPSLVFEEEARVPVFPLEDLVTRLVVDEDVPVVLFAFEVEAFDVPFDEDVRVAALGFDPARVADDFSPAAPADSNTAPAAPTTAPVAAPARMSPAMLLALSTMVLNTFRLPRFLAGAFCSDVGLLDRVVLRVDRCVGIFSLLCILRATQSAARQIRIYRYVHRVHRK